MNNDGWLEKDRNVLANVLPRCTDIVAVRGEGSYIWDADGNKYLDFSSGIAANSTGHCHPQVVAAIKRQAETLIHTSVTTHNKLNILLASRMQKLCPFFEEPQVFFTNSGAEAVDGSLKLARRVTGRSGIIAFQGAFHGRTVAATSLTTAKRKYRDGYTPHLPYVYNAPYNDENYYLEDLEVLIESAAYKIGAMIVEPVLGEGGYIVPDKEFLEMLRFACDEYGILLIFDEVQTGIGRTGHWFAAETFGVTPDVILFAKGIASGLPLGGIIAPRSIMDQWPEGTHGSTFGGNPVSCAAALATLDVVEPLLPRVREKGAEVLRHLQTEGWVSGCGRENANWGARGVGYMIAIQLSSKPVAERVQQLCLERGLLVLLCGPHEDTLRLIPPLTATDADWTSALGILRGALVDGILMYST